MDIYVDAGENIRIFSKDGKLRGEITSGLVQNTHNLISEVEQSRKLNTMHRLIKQVIERIKDPDYSTGLLAGFRGDKRKTGVMHQLVIDDPRWRGFESTDYYPDPPKSLSGNSLQQFIKGWHDGYLLRKWGASWQLFNRYTTISDDDGLTDNQESRIQESIEILTIETESQINTD